MWFRKAAVSQDMTFSYVINESLTIPPVANHTHDIRDASKTQKARLHIKSRGVFVCVFNS